MKKLMTVSATVFCLAALAAATPSAQPQALSDQGKPGLSGKTLFENYCATCHGARAVGDGPLASHLRKLPANLTLLAQRNNGVFSSEMVARIIDGRKPLAGHGGGDMPVWGDAFDRSADGQSTTSPKIAAIVMYLETIQAKQ
jgi:mono/diheme cytochrome c family protein